MKILVPIDGSGPSDEALALAIQIAKGLDAQLDVVHVTDKETDATAEIVANAEAMLDESDALGTVEIVFDEDADAIGASTTVGKDILDLVEERGYDHVVMGTHSGGTIESVFVGSASETVLEGAEIPVTVVP